MDYKDSTITISDDIKKHKDLRWFGKSVTEQGKIDDHMYIGDETYESLLDSRILHKELNTAMENVSKMHKMYKGSNLFDGNISNICAIMEQRVENIVRDIAYALTGKEINFVEENNEEAN